MSGPHVGVLIEYLDFSSSPGHLLEAWSVLWLSHVFTFLVTFPSCCLFVLFIIRPSFLVGKPFAWLVTHGGHSSLPRSLLLSVGGPAVTASMVVRGAYFLASCHQSVKGQGPQGDFMGRHFLKVVER